MSLPSEDPGASAPPEPRMGVYFPLAEFERRALADPDVLGVLYTGSLGRGGGDRCSDIDITLWLRDEALARPGQQVLEHYLGWLGQIHLLDWSQHEHSLSSNAFVGPDWQQAELEILGSRLAEPDPAQQG